MSNEPGLPVFETPLLHQFNSATLLIEANMRVSKSLKLLLESSAQTSRLTPFNPMSTFCKSDIFCLFFHVIFSV